MWHGFFCCLRISPHGRQTLWQHGWIIALTSLSMQTLQVMSDWLGVGSACSSAAWVGSSSASPLTSFTELNLALHYNWSKFDKWQIWTYFHWTWFDSLNYIRELESPNLFIKTSIILIRELKTLNLFIKSLMILIRDLKFPNLIHWTCLNWT